MQLRQPAQLQAFPQFTPDKSRGMFQRFNRRGLFLARSIHADEDARMLHVWLDAHLACDHAAFEPRIFQLASQHSVDFVSDFFTHAFVTMVGCTHRRTSTNSSLLKN